MAADPWILLVDDDAGIREALSMVLADEGYRVLVAEDGADALRLLRASERLPAVILLDLMMPVMDGYQFRAAQLADATLAGIPVIVLTAGMMSGGVAALGARSCLRKPLDLDRLLHELQDLVGA